MGVATAQTTKKVKMQGTPHKLEKRQGNGLSAEYESKGENTVKSYTAIDGQINFSWDTLVSHYAVPNIDVADFTVKWMGGVFAPKAGKYTFILEADDGVRLSLNNYRLIDEWREQDLGKFSAEVYLKGEQIYDLRLDYMQVSGAKATIRLKWKYENEAEELIPQKYLFADYYRKPLKPEVTVESNDKVEPDKPLTANKGDDANELLKKKKVTLNHISFEKGSAVLNKESFTELDQFAKLLKENPNLRIEVAGHTDDVGEAGANLRLSKNRATAVANYLISKGVEEKRIIANGYGSKEPLIENFTEEDRMKNRRVEIRVID
jgi:outer membrane protein OmpA-like peptidoglycan-associated protein